MSRRRDPLEDALAEALSADLTCPPPATFLRDQWVALDEDERRRIERHVERCLACAAERESALLFNDDQESTSTAADEAWVIERLERLRPAAGGTAGGSPRTGPHVDWRLATAAALASVIILGGLAWRSLIPRAPQLPAPAPPAVLRGLRVELESPRGDLREAPRELRWKASPGAESYRVRLVEVDGNILWEATTDVARATLPQTVVDALDEEVTYHWNVDAYGVLGQLVGASDAVAFRVRTSTNGGAS